MAVDPARLDDALVEQPDHRVAPFGVDKIRDPHSHDFIDAHPGHLTAGPVDVVDRAVHFAYQDDVAGVLGEQAVALLACVKGLFGELSLGDVVEEDQHRLLLLPHYGHGIYLKPSEPAG